MSDEPTPPAAARLLSRRTFARVSLATALAPGVAFGAGASQMRLRFAFDRHVFTASLHDTSVGRDLVAMLPLDLTIEDYANNEKIAYLPKKLDVDGSQAFAGEAAGDLCYYAPWGNLVFYYAAYRYSHGLVRLGRLDGGLEPLMTRGRYPLRIDAVA